MPLHIFNQSMALMLVHHLNSPSFICICILMALTLVLPLAIARRLIKMNCGQGGTVETAQAFAFGLRKKVRTLRVGLWTSQRRMTHSRPKLPAHWEYEPGPIFPRRTQGILIWRRKKWL